ncbi:hypothetical protein MMC18_006539 [Xylographa bjoerkii]|nr:hypothetical protein [Xylographa bjoerkii]
MKSTLSALVLLLMSTAALASTKNEQTNIIQGSNTGKVGGDQKNENKVSLEAHAHVHAVRSLKSLFQRDPDFEFAMGILARNAEAAEKTVDQIAADIKKGTVDPAIVQAAKAKGLITEVTKPKRSLQLEARAGAITGPKGQPHDTMTVAQHIMTDGYIPPAISQALVASKHYLVPGQSSQNPTKPPAGGAAKGGKGKTSASPSSGKTAKGGKRDLSPRDVASLYVRDVEDIYERDFDDLYERDVEGLYERDVEGLYERDFDSLYERDLDGLYERDFDGLYEREAEPEVSHKDLKALMKATMHNPAAEKAVYQALTTDPNVEMVTEQLIAEWA